MINRNKLVNAKNAQGEVLRPQVHHTKKYTVNVYRNVRKFQEKYEEEYRRILLEVTLPGEVVFDGCAGNFTLGRVCAQEGRRFIGCAYLAITSIYRNVLFH
jgi:DNA modification methylase